MADSAAAATRKRVKRIRGTFRLPEPDYARIAKLKAIGKRNGLKLKKNELFRLGLQSLQALTPAQLYDLVMAMRLRDIRRG